MHVSVASAARGAVVARQLSGWATGCDEESRRIRRWSDTLDTRIVNAEDAEIIRSMWLTAIFLAVTIFAIEPVKGQAF